MDLQSGFSCCRADEANHDFQCLQRHALPGPCDMAEQTMLDFIPFAGARRVVAHFNPQPCIIRKLLQCPAPKSSAWTVAASAIRCNQQAFSLGVTFPAHSLPPPSNGGHRKFSGITDRCAKDVKLLQL